MASVHRLAKGAPMGYAINSDVVRATSEHLDTIFLVSVVFMCIGCQQRVGVYLV
eukprot:m.1457808 g.1457808  ORF g.1457808 m.1457808 type:complete len:54 (-) comp25121_c0_seq70:2876-3037(-)